MDKILESNLVAMEYSRFFVNALLETIPEDKLCYQPFPEANHALWIMGHLPAVDVFLREVCGGPSDERMEKWKPIFFMGSKATPDPDAYPPVAEVRAWFQEARQTTLDWYRGQDEAQLRTPLPEDLQQIATDRLTLIARLAVHESGHAGQLTVIRKSLGMPPVFA